MTPDDAVSRPMDDGSNPSASGHPGPGSVSKTTEMPVSDLSDAQLVVAIARYREDALAEAYRRHGGAVSALARRVTGDGGEAEDVVQEVFLRLWRQPDRFDPARGSLRTFLLAQSHGRAVDLVRSKVARQRREERDARDTAGAGYDIEREVWDAVVAEKVTEAMSRLPVEERTPIELAYFQGHTYREVADLLAQPEGTVKSRIRSGLKRMRNAMTEIGVKAP
jgi:RNA polymerase sigma-70 factor (ECF subfamily)